MVDEVDLLLDLVRKRRERQLFANLRAAMSTNPALAWLLIVRDSHFYNPDSVHLAGPLFERAIDIPMVHFERAWADKLIREPAEHAGFVYDSEGLIAQIATETAGNPYLIQGLCWYVIDCVRKSHRTAITAADLAVAKALLLHNGWTYFFHLYDGWRFRDRCVVEAVATVCEPGEWGDVGKVFQEIPAPRPNLLPPRPPAGAPNAGMARCGGTPARGGRHAGTHAHSPLSDLGTVGEALTNVLEA